MSDKSILVVEDNATLQKLVTLFAKRCGVEVELAGSSAEAIEAVTSDRAFDLILMDWTLPDGNGLDCTGKIRELLKDRPRTPIIAMTANLMDGDREKCLDAGMDDFLGKPFSLSQFCSVIERWVNNDQVTPLPYRPSAEQHRSQSA